MPPAVVQTPVLPAPQDTMSVEVYALILAQVVLPTVPPAIVRPPVLAATQDTMSVEVYVLMLVLLQTV